MTDVCALVDMFSAMAFFRNFCTIFYLAFPSRMLGQYIVWTKTMKSLLL